MDSLITVIFIVILLTVRDAFAQELTGTREGTFNPKPQNTMTLDSLATSKCMGVQGDFRGCRECYPCDSDFITEYKKRNNDEFEKITVTNSSCDDIETCCVSPPVRTDLYLDRSAYEQCGIVYPQGWPADLRKQVLLVLPGEYPWRAWIYRGRNVACAATLVSKTSRVFITSATCVKDTPAEHLKVAFSREARARNMMRVDKISVNPNYKHMDRTSDLAAVLLAQECQDMFPDFATAACLPQARAFPRDCIAVSNGGYYINTIIPRKDECDKDENTKTHVTHTCSVLSRSHHLPEVGSGLLCLSDQYQTTTQYVLFGVALYQQDDFTTIYTNVTYFSEWIKTVVDSVR